MKESKKHEDAVGGSDLIARFLDSGSNLLCHSRLLIVV